MKILHVGSVPTEMPDDWKTTVNCNEVLSEKQDKSRREEQGCGALLEVTLEDLQLRRWVQDCGYKGMRYYHAFVICPGCEARIPLTQDQLHPYLLEKWKRQSSFDGYSVPSASTHVANGTW